MGALELPIATQAAAHRWEMRLRRRSSADRKDVVQCGFRAFLGHFVPQKNAGQRGVVTRWPTKPRLEDAGGGEL